MKGITMRKIQNKIPTKVQKYLSSAITGIKNQTPSFHVSTVISVVFHGRKRLKSLHLCTNNHFLPSFNRHRHSHRHEEEHESGATLEDIDQYLFENFRSLFGDNENDDREVEEETRKSDIAPSLKEIQVPRLIDLLGSDRFFVTPGSSRSLIEEARTESEDYYRCKSFNETALERNFSANSVENLGLRVSNDCVALVTASASPYEDFFGSMVDVTKARAKNEQRIDWEFLEGLLFTYLRMNEEEYYRFVLMAFVDLVVGLRPSYSSGSLSRELEFVY